MAVCTACAHQQRQRGLLVRRLATASRQAPVRGFLGPQAPRRVRIQRYGSVARRRTMGRMASGDAVVCRLFDLLRRGGEETIRALASAIVVVVLLFSTRNSLFFLGGNLTEGYAACFSMLVLAGLLWQSQHGLVWFLMGVAGAMIALSKQSEIAVPVAVGVTLAWKALAGGSAQVRRSCIAYFSGGLSVVAIAVLVMGVLGILTEFWDTNVVFNRLYLAARGRDMGLLPRLYLQVSKYESLGFLNTSVFIFVATSIRLLFRRDRQVHDGSSPGANHLARPGSGVPVHLVALPLLRPLLPRTLSAHRFGSCPLVRHGCADSCLNSRRRKRWRIGGPWLPDLRSASRSLRFPGRCRS